MKSTKQNKPNFNDELESMVDEDKNEVLADESDALIQKLNSALKMAQEKERRAVADYQNLVRRSQEERIRTAKFATLDFVETILEPLGHLSLAAAQIDDSGLNMVLAQLWEKLNAAGLEEINPLGEIFNVETMEAVGAGAEDRVTAESHKERENKTELKVKKVILKGYKLNGEVIRHAKVVVED